jgi:hypothetical protein
MTVESYRLEQARKGHVDWYKWGPYLSERQWGTVREDYSEDGNAWSYFPHDQARSRAYRWGKMAWGALPITITCCALPWPCGTGKTPCSRSGCLASPTARVTTGKM